MINKRIVVFFLLFLVLSCGGGPGDDPSGNVVTLNLNGGRFVDGSALKYGGASLPTPLREIISSIVTDPVVSDGRAFAVWNTRPDGSGEDYIGDTLVDKSVTLYAIYADVIRTRSDMENIVCGDETKVYTLDENISLALGTYWEPLCPSSSYPFKGRIYGKGKQLAYFATRTTAAEMPYNSGLFARIENARIMDLKMLKVRVAGRESVGAVAGIAVNSVIDRVDVTGELSGYGFVGGVAGSIKDGTVVSRSSFGDISVHDEKSITISGTGAYAGGIAGYSENSEIAESSSSSYISTAFNNSSIGGLVGLAENSKIKDSIHSGTVTAASGYNVTAGGIAGGASGSEINFCYTDTIIKGSSEIGSYTGGLAGYAGNSRIVNSSVFGISVSGADSARVVGSSVGSAIENTYARNDLLVNYKSVADSNIEGIGRKITDMRKSVSFFQNSLSFDFSSSWVFPDYYEFPRLRWENVPAFTRILTAAELRRMSRDLNGWYVLVKDIDLAEVDELGVDIPWSPVGGIDSPFTGRFDGDGKTISNLVLPTGSSEYKGLFGMTSGATISDLGIVLKINNSLEEDTTSYSNSFFSGGAAGYALNSKIERVAVKGNMLTSRYKSFTSTTVYSGTVTGRALGGYMAHSSFEGNITNFNGMTAAAYVGGLIGDGQETGLYYLQTSGAVSTNSLAGSQVAGGIAGRVVNSVIADSCSSMNVYAAGAAASRAGGIAGAAETSGLMRSYALGDIHASSVDYTNVTADVMPKAGGIAGYISGSEIVSSLAFGSSVKADTVNTVARSIETFASRVAGDAVNSTASSVYANTNTAVEANNTGSGISGTDLSATGVTQSFFRDTLGWDFENVWVMPQSEQFPVLLQQQ